MMKRRFAQGIGLSLVLTFGLQAQAEEESINLPTLSNSTWEDTERLPDLYRNPYKVSLFSADNGEDKERLWSQTKSITAYGFGVAGFLAMMPASFTNWDKSDLNLGQKWWDNVSSGPVWDRDDFAVNYIGHPYFGGVYYQVARKSGYRQWDAFMYSFLMSTFYWEYGIEAFAETPSIQDLVVTPVLGWVYGEWAFQTERQIWQQGGTVMGSSFLGSTSLLLLDPVDSIGRGMNRLFGQDVVKAGTGYVSFRDITKDNGETDRQIQATLVYNIGPGEASPGISGKRSNNPTYDSSQDPVDYGIVGISLGSDYLNTDNYWGVNNDWAPTASLGLYFTRRFSARLNYSIVNATHKQTGQNVFMETYSFDGQYYFNPQGRLRPYITTGFGETMRDKSRDDKAFQVNAGAGLHVKLNPNWAVQMDWRHYHSTKLNSNDQQMGARLVYRFGKGERAL